MEKVAVKLQIHKWELWELLYNKEFEISCHTVLDPRYNHDKLLKQHEDSFTPAVIVRGISFGRIISIFRTISENRSGKFSYSVSEYEDLKDAGFENEVDYISGKPLVYIVLVEDSPLTDVKTIYELSKGNINMTTLHEQLIFDLMYYYETNQYPQDVVACGGSRDRNGNVPYRYWKNDVLYIKSMDPDVYVSGVHPYQAIRFDYCIKR